MSSPDPESEFLPWLDQRNAALARLDKQYGCDGNYVLGPCRYDWREIERQIGRLITLPRPQEDSEGIRRKNGVPGKVFDQYLNTKAEIFLACCWAEQVPPPQFLVQFIARQLGTRSFGYQHKKPMTELEIARAYVARNPDTTAVGIAAAAGVSPKTPYRWRKRGLLRW